MFWGYGSLMPLHESTPLFLDDVEQELDFRYM
jgi:hypothetical protein